MERVKALEQALKEAKEGAMKDRKRSVSFFIPLLSVGHCSELQNVDRVLSAKFDNDLLKLHKDDWTQSAG